MEVPRVGDTFEAPCPFCSAEQPVVHAIFNVTKKGKKYSLDTLCTKKDCFKAAVGSFNQSDEVVYITWLDYEAPGKPNHLKTEKITTFKYQSEWAERLAGRPYPTAQDEQKIMDFMVEQLHKYQFPSKSSLEFALAKRFPQFAEVNLNFINTLRISFPPLPNLAKTLRLRHAITFGVDDGHHVYGQGKEIADNRHESQDLAWKILKDHQVAPGPIEASVFVYLPTEEERRLGHFFQAIIPEAQLKTAFGTIPLQCHFKDKKNCQAHFKLDGTECTFNATSHLLELTGKFQEKYLSRSLIKLVIIGLKLAREMVAAAHESNKILTMFGHANFPATVVIHNSLRGSDELWQTQYSNIHRTFYAFPEVKPNEDYSLSERLILSRTLAGRVPDDMVAEHLAKFRSYYLRELLTVLERAEQYVPPSVLKVYAPKGDDSQEFFKELTGLYEEKLKKSQLARDQRDREMKLFMNRSNMWLSMIVLLFSLANIVQETWFNWIVAAISVLLVLFIVVKNFKIKSKQDDEE